MNPENFSARIKNCAPNTEFELVGLSPAALNPQDVAFWKQWIVGDHHGEMRYLEKFARESIVQWFPEARSVLLVGLKYAAPYHGQAEKNLAHAAQEKHGRIASYAQYPDYHVEMKKRLQNVLERIKDIEPKTQGKIFVDTSPILERSYAQQASLGWIGKNTMLINKKEGSYFFIGGIALNLELTPDQPDPMSHCGTCTRCIDACPTQCLTPYHLNANNCISYLTIEKKTMETNPGLASKMGSWIFGCDICQSVCPFNKQQKTARDKNETKELTFSNPAIPSEINLEEINHWTESNYRDRFRGFPMGRVKWPAFLRNCRIAAENLESHPRQYLVIKSHRR
ncbi:MAG: tRNA epoxyqueuosine(34) reductase QueG [Elusimicrobia bacterium]|nr:tRNA epoxyqueuosine(34) reductase QueG [Elusimicrobiota bacterium]